MSIPTRIPSTIFSRCTTTTESRFLPKFFTKANPPLAGWCKLAAAGDRRGRSPGRYAFYFHPVWLGSRTIARRIRLRARGVHDETTGNDTCQLARGRGGGIAPERGERGHAAARIGADAGAARRGCFEGFDRSKLEAALPGRAPERDADRSERPDDTGDRHARREGSAGKPLY